MLHREIAFNGKYQLGRLGGISTFSLCAVWPRDLKVRQITSDESPIQHGVSHPFHSYGRGCNIGLMGWTSPLFPAYSLLCSIDRLLIFVVSSYPTFD